MLERNSFVPTNKLESQSEKMFVPTNEITKINTNSSVTADDFMFRLTKDEVDAVRLRSQIVTTNTQRGGSRYLPYAFTELGVAMLSSVPRRRIGFIQEDNGEQ